MPHPFLIVSQSDSFIQIVDRTSHTEWQTVQIQISWFLQKPTDLDLDCLQRQDISGFSRTRINCIKSVFSGLNKQNLPYFLYNMLKMPHIALDKKYQDKNVSLFLHKNICSGYALEACNRDTSNKYQQCMFLWKNKKTTNIECVKEGVVSSPMV